MENVKIKIIEAKDALNRRVPIKYKGSLDWGQEIDYILNTEEVKNMIRIEGDKYYSDDIVTVTFNYQEVKEVSNYTEEEWERIESLNLAYNSTKSKAIMDNIKEIKEKQLGKVIEEEQDELTKGKVEELNSYRDSRNTIREELENEFRKRSTIYTKIRELNNKNNRSKKGKDIFTKENSENLKEFKKLYNLDFNNYLKENEKYKKEIENIKIKEEEIKVEKEKVENKYIIKTDALRIKLYKEGFYIGDKHFVRYKRSSGSARVGKVLFINEKYYQHMIDWSFADIDIKGKEIDIAGIEAYISLPLSSAINKFKLKPENILLVEDVVSTFKDTVYATEYIDEKLKTSKKEIEIKNKIFDGQSLLDESIFLELGYVDKADLQLRNRFYKGTGVRCKIQDFFRNNNITEIRQLNGVTIAKDIKDIKIITTPSSVKYLKFVEGTLEEQFNKWLNIVAEDWYVCKYEKPQKHLHSMVQTHYQLLNSLGIDKKSFEEFLEPTIDYIEKLKNNNDAFLNHIKVKCDGEMDEGDNYILSMLKWNKNFIDTVVAKEFRKDSYTSYIKNARKGHILVDGNYSIVANNVLEMLYHSIGRLIEVDIDGKKAFRIHGQDNIKLEGYNVISSKFKDGTEILSVRSPQPTMSNVAVYNNIKNEDNLYYNHFKKYFYLSKEVVYTNSINVNRMEKASSEDMDGDAELLTDNSTLVEYAKKLQDKFLVNNDKTEKTPEELLYTPENLANTDIKCSKNKIGEIINLAQVLNTIYWRNVGKKDDKWLEELFKNICTLNALSCIEIDRCKKVSPVDSSKEINRILDLKYIESYKVDIKGHLIEECYSLTAEEKKAGYRLVKFKPNFLKYCNQFKLGNQTIKVEDSNVFYRDFGVGMDLLETILDKKIKRAVNSNPTVSLEDLLDKDFLNKKKENRRQIDFIKNVLDKGITGIKQVRASKDDIEIKLSEEEEIIDETIKGIDNKKVTLYNMARIIYKCEKFLKSKDDIKKAERILEKLDKEDLTEEEKLEIEKCTKKIADCLKFIEDNEIYRNYRNIVKILFKTNKAMFLKIFKPVANDKILTRVKDKCDNSITLYNVNYALKDVEYTESKAS